jgi:putative heme-binding domain-containing protein
MFRKILCIAVCVFVAFLSNWTPSALGQELKKKPLRALLIAGGCCHDYAKQQEALVKGIQARANVQVDVYWTDNSTTTPVLPIYSKLNWAEEYDVIIHDECAADIKDPAILNRIIQTHQKLPAVHLHCAMHSFRTGSDAWFQHLGLQSTGHGPQEPIEIQFVESKHPIIETLSNWTTIREELYNNVKVFDAKPLAIGKQTVKTKDGSRVEEAIVAWINESRGARSFSTTIGHNTETVQDARYLELVTRGLLWACNQLNDEYLTPVGGENKVTFIDKNKFKAPSDAALGKAPEGATLVKVTASSTQSQRDAFFAVDGKADTRWCADGPAYPQWLQFEFEKPQSLTNIEIAWESGSATYAYVVEGSEDGKKWDMLLDQSKNQKPQKSESLSASQPFRWLRITGLGSNAGWCSIWEVKLQGAGLGPLWPADPKKDKGAFVPVQEDIYANSGNIIPRIEPLTAAAEQDILKDVQVPDGFVATVFAAPPAVNYPVFVASTVDGTVFVSSDGNGSLGRSPQRGRVIRLRDTDGDGRADETKVFCEIDAPRGLVWDHDRLYLMHPPHLSAFIDNDGDGVADEQKILVKNLAFDYDKRPADHTTNGVSIGVDGWLYIAGGDFGFLNAEGTDGRRLTHRGGGVIRVRPDGTGLEIYSTGTRNILEVAISPQMDMFARDNTNDGGGWDVRLHHFTGSDDHGYPRLYKNFNDECVQPLADYGGGSGCGAVYIDEPGFGKWGNAPFTADWGTGSLYRHTVATKGSTFSETAKPESFIKMTRPTDADVDGNSRVYAASWRGATFDWAGPNVGYIVCVKPKGFQPDPMPQFHRASDSELVSLMKTSSYRRRVEAQRELMRRKSPDANRLLADATASRSDSRNLLDRLQSTADVTEMVTALHSDDPVIVHTAIRCLAKKNAFEACFQELDSSSAATREVLRALAMMHQAQVVDGLISRLQKESDTRKRYAILGSLCRLYHLDGTWKGDSWGTRPDTRGPYYQPEGWSETSKLDSVLQTVLGQAGPEEAAVLVDLMQRNRIQSSSSLTKLLELAKSKEELLAPALTQLATLGELPDGGLDVVLRGANRKSASPAMLADVVVILSKLETKQAPAALLTALTGLTTQDTPGDLRMKARDAFVNSPKLDLHVNEWVAAAESGGSPNGLWPDIALLAIASRNNVSPEAREQAKNAIAKGWQQNTRQTRLIRAAMESKSPYLNDQILGVASDGDEALKKLALSAIEKLKIKPKAVDGTPKISSLTIEETAKQVVSARGDKELGKQIFAKANCAACHTVSQDEVQKGPYLGNIAKTYKRPELALAILEPSKTIAQGFATNLLRTDDDVVLTGFVTSELPDRVTIRDQQGKETTIMKENIEERKTSPTSVMPSGVMNEFTTHELSSLLDYLESLAP